MENGAIGMKSFGKLGGMEIRYTKEGGLKFDVQVPVYPFVAKAIGAKPKAYGVVDKWYNANKYKYYRAAIEDHFYRHEIVTGGCLLQVEYARKALGLMTFFKQEESNSQETATYQSIIKIIKKAYPRAYQYMLKNNELSIEAYIRTMSQKNNGIKNKDISGLGDDLVVALYLAELQGKVIVKSPVYMEFVQKYLIQRIERASNIRGNTISIKNIPPVLIEPLKCLEEKVRKDNLTKEIANNLNYPHYKDDYWSSKYKKLWDYEKLSSVDIYENTTVDEEMYQKLSLAYIVNELPDNEINLEDFRKYMISGSIILRLIQAYNEAKESYFRNHKEVMYVEMETLEMEKRRLHLESRNFEYKFECTVKQTEKLEKQFKDYEITKEKQIKRLEEELAEAKKNQVELIALREMVFAQKIEEEKIWEGRDYSYLKKVQVVFVGGHSNWQKKMKEFLPESIFIGADSVNFDLNLLKGTIFINTTYIGHAMYYRVINSVTSSNCRLYYLNQVNIDICLAKVEKWLQQ